MLGLYVHIPFCVRRCPYCDFAVHVGAGESFVAEYVAALALELESVLRPARRTITSIFFGGGTPTALPASTLNRLLRLIHEYVGVAEDAEVSLEANPEDLHEEQLSELHEGGWNRISMGAQSFDDEALHALGRRHTAADIERSFEAARRAGFDNISLDLMYALPGQSRARWRETLEQALSLQPEHLSCYALTIEPSTHFARRVEAGNLIPLDDSAQAEQMQDAAELASGAGLERYEISNYARAGRECRHNLNYWRGGDYLAAGCGAHGHRGGHRWWNERDAKVYVQGIQSHGQAREGEERLTAEQRLNELVMLGLRLREGFDLEGATRKLSLDARRVLDSGLRELQGRGVLSESGGYIRLTPEAVPIADAVAARLMC